MRFLRSIISAFSIFLLAPAFSEAALLTISSPVDGKFVINGSSMDGVSGMELIVSYDSARLGNPVVNAGGLIANSTMMVNTNNPGTIKIALVRATAYSGSGQVFDINFATHTGGGSISISKLFFIDFNGNPVTGSVGSSSPAGDSFWNAGTKNQEQQTQGSSTTTATTATTPAGTAAYPSIGTITLPGDSSSQPQPQKTAETAQPGYQQVEKAPQPVEMSPVEKTKPAAPTKDPEIKQTRYAGIVERFRNFKGDRTLDALTNLFSKPVGELVRQEPPIAINTGDTIIRIFAGNPLTTSDTVPTVATKGAKLLSLKNDDSGKGWILELAPRKELLEATVSILIVDRVIEIPLVVIPPVDKLSFLESGVAAFMKDFGAEKPQFDLNKDGKHDYIDDYIFTGHYLLEKKLDKDKSPPAKEKPGK